MHSTDLALATRARPLRLLSILVGAATFTLLSSNIVFAQDIPPGFFLSKTDPPTTTRDFASAPIPAGFFGPGSDPFDGQVTFGGEPLGPGPWCTPEEMLDVDTLIERLGPAHLPGIPSSDVIPIEIVAMSLVSAAPIVVTYDGGLSPELWDLDIGVSALGPSSGQMAITKTHENGGIFSADILVLPVFTFTRIADGQTWVMDLGLPDVYEAFDVPWEYGDPPPTSCTRNFCPAPGDVLVFTSPAMQHGLRSLCPVDAPRDVDPGCDLFATEAPITARNHASDPIPADFFGPGSDPFDGIIHFDGQPLLWSPHCPLDDLEFVDAIIERPLPAVLPGVPSSDVIPIEIVELSLVSVAPILVTYSLDPPELWDVELSVSSLEPSVGQMELVRLFESGGMATVEIDFVPVLIFRLQGSPELRVLDYGALLSSEHLQADAVPWAYAPLPAPGSCTSNFCLNPGGLTLLQGPVTTHGLISDCESAVAAPPSASSPVAALFLIRCRPNPSRDRMTISWAIPDRLDGAVVKLDLYDVAGRHLRRLFEEFQPAGAHGVTWNGIDQSGRPVPAGVYFYRLTVGRESATGRMVRLK